MTKNVGIFREKDSLEEAKINLEKLEKQLSKINFQNKRLLFNQELFDYLQLENMILLCKKIVHKSLIREESRGAFQRRGFPKTDDKKWRKHSLIGYSKGKVKYSNVDVSK